MAITKKWWIAIGIVIVVVVGGSIAGYELTKPTTKNIVLYTWWATEGKIALQKEIPAFEKANPGYSVSLEITPGGGGDNSVATVLSLIEAGKPPDAFQAHMGPMMYSYVSADSQGQKGFVNWTSYYETNLTGHVIPAAFEAGSMNGVLLSMPVEVHTMGLLYMNDAVLHHYGLPIPTNVWMLQNDTNALVTKGFDNSTEAPWGISANEGGWAQLQLWENNFLGLAGTKLYNEFTYGTLNTSNPSVSHIINQTNALFLNESKYDYPGWQTMSWTQMASELISGHVAFLTAGDFVTNYMYDYYNTTSYPVESQYINNSSTPVLVESFPSTQNYFVVNLDSIGVPTGPTAAAGTLFVKYWTSPAGNKVWTQWKGLSYYNNITTNYYNTPEQWYMYQKLVHTTNPSDFVYALSDGGLFASPDTTLTGNLLSLQESSGSSKALSTWTSGITSQIGVEKSTWLSANNLSLGYLGFPGAPFGGYLPPWANSTYNLTGSGSHAVADLSSYYSSSHVSTQASSGNSVSNAPTVEVTHIGSSSLPFANIDFKAVAVNNFKPN